MQALTVSVNAGNRLRPHILVFGFQEVDDPVGVVGEGAVDASLEVKQLQHVLEVVGVVGHHAVVGAEGVGMYGHAIAVRQTDKVGLNDIVRR